MPQNINNIWEYFREVARTYGRNKEGKKQNYSLEYFYDDWNASPKNDLLRAFLGDRQVCDSLAWNEAAPTPEQIRKLSSSVTPPYDAQVEAIRRVVSNPISVVQGPPGTGKTEMILNLLSVIHALYPTATVAVVSGNREAVQNITDKIREGKNTDPKLAELDRVYAVLGNKNNRKEWRTLMSDRGESVDCFDSLPDNKAFEIRPEFLERYPIFSSTIHSLRRIFKEQNGFCNQFDYVIADECSQISSMVGLVAMGSAKHLVLIGDDQQLPPIVRENELKDIHSRFSSVPEIYRESESHPFLTVCEKVFEGRIASTLLNQHYRCHPAIIGFCNEYIYNGQLQIMKKPDGKFPLRVLWYEGDYYEKHNEHDSEYSCNQNMKQLAVFMAEEWQQLLKRFRDEPKLSVCVIAPFRKQLKLLEKLLEKDAQEEALEVHLEEAQDANFHTVPQLTIHKAQGRGFDVVYFMAVEDCSAESKWPWSQKRRMINVAVSRAKKEFRMITSGQWLPPTLQKKLTGYVLPVHHPTYDEEDNLFIHKLLYYIDEKGQSDEVFGFHKSKLASVFDKVPLYRLVFETGKNMQDQYSASARCMRDALFEKLSEEHSICAELPLNALTPQKKCDDEELLSYSQRARLDFVICKGTNALLTIEIDGAQHRYGNEYQDGLDEKKDTYIKTVLPELPYLRIPTDGTTQDEMERLAAIINNEETKQAHVQADPAAVKKSADATKNEYRKDKLVKHYKLFMLDRLEGLKKYTDAEPIPQEVMGTLKRLNFSDQNSRENIPYGNELLNDFYLCRYGIAYAFEYAMIYEIMLRDFITNENIPSFGVSSFGCGSMIDAWSLAYAKAKLGDACKDIPLYYNGYDINEWQCPVFNDVSQRDALFKGFRNDNDLNIANYKGDDRKKMSTSVLMFPKILNELPDHVIHSFAENLKEIKFYYNVFYICVSHSKNDLDKKNYKANNAVKKIVEAINKNKEFEVIDDLAQIMGKEQFDEMTNNLFSNAEDEYFVEYKNDNHYKFYTFNTNNENDTANTDISALNPDFCCDEVSRYIKNLSDRLKNKMKVRRSITTVSQIAFQIIKLKRKPKSQASHNKQT